MGVTALEYDTDRIFSRRRPLIDNDRALELIESAARTQPLCPCGSHTVTVARDDSVRISCATLQQPAGIVRRILTLDFAYPHINREVIDLTEWAVA
jgi:hypothetical protein